MEKNKIQKPVIPNCDLLAENLECINATMAFLRECPGIGMPRDISLKYTVQVIEIGDSLYGISERKTLERELFRSKEEADQYVQLMEQTYPDCMVILFDTNFDDYPSLTEQEIYNKLLKFYGIDPKALEQERREILETISSAG